MSQISGTLDREMIMADVLALLQGLASDWEYSGDITPETYLFSELGFESIDAVVLASHIQEHYKRQFPFPEFLAELGRREVKDLKIGELVDFIGSHLSPRQEGV
jgi:acyl carrier protein